MRIEKKKKNMTMMKKRHILHWAMGVVMTPLLGSCAFDELHEIAGGGNGMSFSVEVTQLQEELGSSFRAPRITDTEISGDGMKMYVRRTTEGYVHRHEMKDAATRGTSVTSISDFVLYSYSYSGTMSSTATPVSSNEKITSSGGWKSQKQWQKASDNMAFYAYNAGSTTATFSLDASGNPTLQYTVADAVANQQDLLVAKAENVTGDDTNKKIGLTFSHALTAVQFGIGSTMADGTIKKIELQGIKNSGTYNYSDGTWSSQSGSQTYTLDNLNILISGNKGTSTATKIITGNGNDLLLLMPQTLSDAKLVVTIESNGKSNNLEMNLPGDWKPGHTVTYSLSTDKETGDYVLKVSNTALTTSKEGGSVSTQVTSYYQDYYGTQKAVAWTATYSFADNTDERTPIGKAFTSKTESSNGNISGEELKATIAKQYLKSQYSFTVDETLRSKALNSASPFDLSTYNPSTGGELSGSGRRSANCYIIKAPGYYKLPLVYGNTLNNLSKATGNSCTTFKDANDKKITTEKISEVKGAKLLWQDEYGLIDPTSISVDGDYLYFQIKEGSITQGNALIAATSGDNGTGNILWSWHIWVTDADFPNKVLIYGGASLNYNTKATSGKKSFNFMKVPLGFCNSTSLKYPERKVNVTITQTPSGGRTANISITQTGSSSAEKTYGENCTFYQWGRKDPFPGSDGIKTTATYNKSTPKYCYDADGNSFEYKKVGGDTSNGRTSKGGSIKNPDTFYYSKTDGDANSTANDWCTETTVNNWSSTETTYDFNDNAVVKSLYDPCPIGFKVPETTCFTGFTRTGDNVWNNSPYYNVSSETYSEGWYFFTTDWRAGTTDFWRAFGFIDCWYQRYDDYTPKQGDTGRGFLGWSGLNGDYWSARAYSAGYGRYLNFNSGSVDPRSTSRRAYGFAVRPVSE